jgi:hypothetical protein
VSIGVGTLSISIFRRDAASSTRSMALSGSCGRDVAVRQLGGGDQRRVLDADAVVDLVALLEAAQDRDGVVEARLADQHRLEPALERLVLLDVLAVLVERRRADAAQLAARQRRLEHVGGVLRALGGAGADHRVQLVDEQDDRALGRGDVLEHRLQALLELAAVLGAGDQRAQVEREQALAAQALGDVAGGDAAGDALDDGGLADAGLADQHRVVLAAARQDLDGAADLVVATDHRIELALLGQLGEVAGELVERLVGGLRVLIGDRAVAAHREQRLEQRLGRGAGLAQRLAGRALGRGQRQHEVLGRQELVLQLARLGGGRLPDVLEPRRQPDVDGGAADGRLLGQRAVEIGGDDPRVGAELGQDARRHAAVLVDQGVQQVLGHHLGVAASRREVAGRGESFLGLDGQLVESHGEGRCNHPYESRKAAPTIAAGCRAATCR